MQKKQEDIQDLLKVVKLRINILEIILIKEFCATKVKKRGQV
jgi:hypothetical protein